MDISNKLIQIGNYFRLGMKLYAPTEKGDMKVYTLTEIKINITSNEYMSVVFICENPDTYADEYITFEHFEDNQVFRDYDKAQEQAVKNFMNYYNGGNKRVVGFNMDYRNYNTDERINSREGN